MRVGVNTDFVCPRIRDVAVHTRSVTDLDVVPGLEALNPEAVDPICRRVFFVMARQVAAPNAAAREDELRLKADFLLQTATDAADRLKASRRDAAAPSATRRSSHRRSSKTQTPTFDATRGSSADSLSHNQWAKSTALGSTRPRVVTH